MKILLWKTVKISVPVLIGIFLVQLLLSDPLSWLAAAERSFFVVLGIGVGVFCGRENKQVPLTPPD